MSGQANTNRLLEAPKGAWLYECQPRYLAGVVLADSEDEAMAIAADRAESDAAGAVANGTWTLRRLDSDGD